MAKKNVNKDVAVDATNDLMEDVIVDNELVDVTETVDNIDNTDNTEDNLRDDSNVVEDNACDAVMPETLPDYVKDEVGPICVTKNQIAFTRLRDVKAPNRGNEHDAGVDFYIPNYDTDFLNAMQEKNKGNNIIVRANGEITIPAHSRVLIPSGIKVWIGDKSSALVAMNKSGVATKTGLIVGACVVDADYTGEVHLSVINTTGNRMYINCGEKLVQFLHLPVILSNFVEIPVESYDKITSDSDRGAGGFGSTGLN